MNWQLQEAKNRLSEVVKAAGTRGPQIIADFDRFELHAVNPWQ